jgi:hypothetical protein
MMFMVPGVYTGYVVALAWISNSLPRPPAKRAAALAFINAISNTSSIYASYMYKTEFGKLQKHNWEKGRKANRCCPGPRYVIAMCVNCGMVAMAVLSATILRFILIRLNRKLEQGIFVEGAINSGTTEAGKKGFRFRI